MPFGAEVLPAGGVRFRLWAPAATQVDLFSDGQLLPMKREGEGWFELNGKVGDPLIEIRTPRYDPEPDADSGAVEGLQMGLDFDAEEPPV